MLARHARVHLPVSATPPPPTSSTSSWTRPLNRVTCARVRAQAAGCCPGLAGSAHSDERPRSRRPRSRPHRRREADRRCPRTWPPSGHRRTGAPCGNGSGGGSRPGRRCRCEARGNLLEAVFQMAQGRTKAGGFAIVEVRRPAHVPLTHQLHPPRDPVGRLHVAHVPELIFVQRGRRLRTGQRRADATDGTEGRVLHGGDDPRVSVDCVFRRPSGEEVEDSVALMTPMPSEPSKVSAAAWVVATTVGMCRRGLVGSMGSCSNTSSAAPDSVPDVRAQEGGLVDECPATS